MPELAEAAVYANDINNIIKNKKLTDFKVSGEKKWRDIIISNDVKKLLKENIGQKNILFESFGKSLVLKIDKSYILFKLGMTGMFKKERPNKAQLIRHNFLILKFNDIILYYLDFRRFSRVSVISEKEFTKIKSLCIGGFKENKGFFLKEKKEISKIIDLIGFSKIKPKISWMLESGSTTGIGNYLANEALGRLGFDPFTPFKTKDEALDAIAMAASVSKKSFKCGGNSFKGGYFRINGKKGDFLRHCKFYKNKEIPCIVFKGRPVYSFFFPRK